MSSTDSNRCTVVGTVVVPPSQQTKVSSIKKKNDENDDPNNSDDRRLQQGLVLKALLTSVDENNDNDKDETDVDEQHNYCRQLFVNLFEPSSNNRKGVVETTTILPGLSMKQQQVMILNAIEVASTDNKSQVLKRFFGRLRSIIVRIIQDDAYIVPSNTNNANNNNKNNNNNDKDSEQNQERRASVSCLLFFKYAAQCCQAALDGRLKRQKQRQGQTENHPSSHRHLLPLKMMPQVYEVASDLHDVLFPLQACVHPEAGQARMSILALCECWWLANGENREQLIAQSLPLLVLDATEDTNFSKSHIRRLCKLREAFLCIDYSNPSSDPLKRLLLQVASNPVCLKTTEGKKFLATLFHDGDLAKDLHLAFRAQIPQAKKSILQAYGEIYLRTWREVLDVDDGHGDDNNNDHEYDGPMLGRQTLEQLVLQDLMHAVIHVASPVTSKAILTVLEPLHSEKSNTEVASLLHRLYSPILWRSLSATNPGVRRNAIVILEEVFPLQDPVVGAHHVQNNNTTNSMKTAVLKATEALQIALNDPDPDVRVTASYATAKICATYWDALPSQEIRTLLNLILIEHSSDAGSAAVRAASLEAASTLLGASQSHGVMRALLPSLGNLIHDKTEKVRLAAVRMLVRIKQIPGIRYYHVVPADQLSARLVEEAAIHRTPKNVVSKELTALMLNSYFPQGENVSGNNQLKRTITYLLTDPDAAFVFYANLADHLQVESIVKLILNLQSCMKSAVETDQSSEVKMSQKEKKRRRHPSTATATDDDNVTNDENTNIDKLSASNTSLMASLAETINILWESILPRLHDPSNVTFKTDLEAHFSSKEIKAYIAHFERKGLECCSSSNTNNDKGSDEIECKRNECFRACSSFLSCASRHSAKSMTDVSAFISSSLASIAKGKGNTVHVIPLITSYLAFMCTSDHVLEVSTSLAKSIEQSLGEEISLFSPSFDDSLGMPRRSRRSILKKDEGIVPTFPTKVAWGVLENILQAVGSEGRSLRDAIMSSDSAIPCLENALKKGIRFAERMLGPDLLGRNFPLDEVENVLHAIDAYGRFSLHKESSGSSEGDCVDDEGGNSSVVVSLIEWTTENVVPALVGSCEVGASNLRNLDVSYISNVNESLIHVAPGSPSISSPPKQKANLGRTPLAMRTSLSSVSERRQHDPPADIAIQFASTLIQYACLLSAEMLAIGKASSSTISKSSVELSKVLRQEGVPLTKPLVVSFVRLANQLCRMSGTFDLLEELLAHPNDLFDEKTFGIDLKRVVKSIMKNASPHTIDNLVKAYLNSVDRFIGLIEVPSEFKVATTSGDVPGTPSTDIFLQAIVGHPTANVSLCQALVAKLSESDGIVTKRDTFLALCLSFVARNANTSRAVARIILEDLDPSRFDEDGGMRAMLQQVMTV